MRLDSAHSHLSAFWFESSDLIDLKWLLIGKNKHFLWLEMFKVFCADWKLINCVLSSKILMNTLIVPSIKYQYQNRNRFIGWHFWQTTLSLFLFARKKRLFQEILEMQFMILLYSVQPVLVLGWKKHKSLRISIGVFPVEHVFFFHLYV